MAPHTSLLRAGRLPLVIAHRGASAVAPENTLPAFTAAFAGGSLWVEADVQPSADGELVLIHDGTVDRTTDGHGAVRSLSKEQLAGLDAGSWFGAQFSGTSIPVLADLLDLASGDRNVLLEVKGEHSDADLAALVSALEKAHAWPRVLLQSFEVDILERLRLLLPHEPFGLLVEEIEGDPVAECRRLGVSVFNADFSELLRHRKLVSALHANEIAVLTWTANDAQAWSRLLDLGVDGIITDDPTRLAEWLAIHPDRIRDRI